MLHNEYGTPYDRAMPKLQDAARAALKGPPIFLSYSQGVALPSSSLKQLLTGLAIARCRRHGKPLSFGDFRTGGNTFHSNIARFEKLCFASRQSPVG
jgi:hypothetical protein